MGTILEKVWGSVSGRPGHTGDQNLLRTLPPFSRVRVPDFLHLELPRAPPGASRHSLHVDALSSWPAAPASRHGSAGCWVLRGDGQGGGGVEGTRPSPGELAAGWLGCPESRTYERPQPLLRAGKQPVLSVDWREVGVTPLASSALPQPEGLGSLGKLSQLHVAGKEVAPESGGPGFSSCVTLCKSFNFSERVSQLLKTALYPTTLGGCRE